MQFLEQVSKEIGKCLHEFKVIVVKSTVPVGTSDKVKQWIKESCSQADDFAVVSNPEFLREGSALYDALQPDRIVIGSDCRQAITILNKLYEQACCPILITSSSSAELIKYASNSFLALKISFVNELAKLCDHLEIDIQGVAEGMGLDHRIGEHFLQAGIGYGGSCFPKDVDALLHTSKKHGVDLTILEKVVEVNKTQPLYMIEKIRNMLGSLKEKKVGILGLAFKPHTDDLRESPSLKILQVLDEEKAIVQVHDPVATLPSSTFSSHITQCETPYLAATDADAILICTDWPEYRQLDWKKINKLLKHPYLFDGRNMLDAHMLSQLGFLYEGVGKKSGVHSSTLL
ncbi:UDP-glucose dehydrogenase family protein [Caldalkalibacillus mannanilyticus]|uniref:UDP-glucose dehydrogenase family protein n=1 Tax=Caldalkalibacillus mannanilyticus TaxID=1418 RepID=UPI000A99801E